MDWAELPTDQVERMLVTAEGEIARIRAFQLEGLRELDARQVANSDGCRTMSEWVAGRLDVGPETAAVLVGVSRRLGDLPFLSKQLSVGEMSFDRAVELSKLANPATEHRVADEALAWDVAGCAARWPAGDG